MLKTLNIEITQENYQRAITENSGGCLVADAIKEQYPELANVEVDMATIRASDRKSGERYIWLTPPSVADILIFFDQGWKEETLPKKLRIRDLVKILPIKASPVERMARAKQKAERIAELEAKQQRGEELTSDENRSLTQLKNRKEASPRPSSTGPVTVEENGKAVVIRGGKAPVRGKKNPNMLAGRRRRFGAKTAKPGVAFQEAVKAAVQDQFGQLL